jgi:CHRD domain
MSKIRHVFTALAAVVACTALHTASAADVFTASMDGSQTVPDPIVTPATGTVELRLSADGTKVEYTITVSKLANPSQADLHLASRGQNGKVVVKLWPKDESQAKRGEFSGVLAQGSFDAGDLGGSLLGSSLKDFIDEVRAGNTYVNVHTYDGADPPYSGVGDYRLGEIRGQLK